ncbi:MAG: hypothetical protein HY544_04955 [Candidatus Diapherotrites archaeon]|uniref:Uncharacterized protein n=1 Tax=Candidatus Iainarchaeum sp. TaxID=3101447 RepID=A0A8T3YNI5_9ARCH|nr:hypothetical protein [Candidatus Diapherotrites archaeon]
MNGRVLIAVNDPRERAGLSDYVTELFSHCIGAVSVDSGDASILNRGQRQEGRAYDFITVDDTPEGVAGVVGLRQADTTTPVYMIGDLYTQIGWSVRGPDGLQNVADYFAERIGATAYADRDDFDTDLAHIVRELAQECMRN